MLWATKSVIVSTTHNVRNFVWIKGYGAISLDTIHSQQIQKSLTQKTESRLIADMSSIGPVGEWTTQRLGNECNPVR